jgi:glucosamine-6-phosphate deaminase
VEIIILPNYQEVNREVTRRILSLIQKKPSAVLGLATGRTPLGIYRELIAAHKRGEADFSRVTTFNLDEYLGFDHDDPVTFHSYMEKNLFAHVNLNPANTHIPPSRPEDLEKACRDYEEELKAAGGIDLQLLGIGREGHIGFNEPSSSLKARTRVKTLTEITLRDNFGDSKGPRFAITMGIGTIMDAKEIILVALGHEKADAVACTVEGAITAMCPASVLQLHPKVKIILDEKAAGKLEKYDYYKWVYEHKHLVEKFLAPKNQS